MNVDEFQDIVKKEIENNKYEKWVYLAGPITGLTTKQYLDWRVYAREEFIKDKIGVFIPFRFQIGGVEEIIGVHRDVKYVADSDLMLVNFLDAKAISKGTFTEYGVAGPEKTIITIMEPKGIPMMILL